MLIMPGNNGKIEVGYLAGKYPGWLGWLFSPGDWKTPKPWLPYALDNGRFKGDEWSERGYLDLLERAAGCEQPPLWAAVPDVLADRDATLADWDKWAPRIEAIGFRLAMVAQDGMSPADIPPGVVCFLGGSTLWKRRNLYQFGADCPRLHIGRINTERWLWHAYRAGAESCDGTGWFRGRRAQLAGLINFLERTQAGKDCQHGEEKQKRFA